MLLAPTGHQGLDKGTKAQLWGQILMGIVSPATRELRRGPQRALKKGPREGLQMGLPAHATVARATALSWRGLLGHCPGPAGRVTHQMVVCCLGHL